MNDIEITTDDLKNAGSWISNPRIKKASTMFIKNKGTPKNLLRKRILTGLNNKKANKAYAQAVKKPTQDP